MEFFIWIEQSAISRWVAETTWGFPISLTLHAIGMGFLAGFNFAFALRLLGVASGVQVDTLVKFFPLMWASAALSLFSGLLLLAAYPAKSMTNPLFYVKIGLIILGLILIRKLAAAATAQPGSNAGFFHGRERTFAAILLLLWCAAITCGLG